MFLVFGCDGGDDEVTYEVATMEEALDRAEDLAECGYDVMICNEDIEVLAEFAKY